MRDEYLGSQLVEHVARFKTWAEGKSNLRRLWLFGSRVRGDARPDSDLDIAFEIDALVDDADKETFLEEVLPRWQAELQSISAFPVHLEPWAAHGTDVAAYVAESGISIYQRTE